MSTAHPSLYRKGEPVRIVGSPKFEGATGVVTEVHGDDPQGYVPYVVAIDDMEGYNWICFSHKNLEPADLGWVDVGRAVELAQEALLIETAIEQAQIGYTNARVSGSVGGKFDFHGTRIFRGLSKRREEIRAALVALGPESIN
jgi:hypothetical protein